MQNMHGESPGYVPTEHPKGSEKEWLGVREKAETAFNELRKEAGDKQAKGLAEGQSDHFAATREETLKLNENKMANISTNFLYKFAEKKGSGVDEKRALEAIMEIGKDKNFKLSFGGALNFRGNLKIRSNDYLKTKELVVKKLGVSNENFDLVMGEARDEYVKVSLVVNIMKDPKNQTPEKLVALENWNKSAFDRQELFKNGEMDPVKYAEEERKAYKHAVDEFGDEDAKKMWEAYEKGELDMDSKKAEEVILSESTVGVGIGIVDVAEAIGVADKALGTTGVSVNYSFIDGASIESPDGFSLPLKVGKGVNGYSFYLKDSKSQNGVIGPIKAQDLAVQFDHRYVDNMFTQRVSKLMNNNEEISKIPDKLVVNLLYKILGDGVRRGFSFNKQQRAIMDTLSKVLVLEDGKYPTMYKKMMALTEFVKKESGVNYFVKNLSKGLVRNVSEFLSEGDAGEELTA